MDSDTFGAPLSSSRHDMIDQRIFERAVEAAQARFPSGVWDRMPAGEKVEAIQAEMRRIDPESMEGLIPLNTGPTGTA